MKNTDFLKLNMPELTDKADIRKMSENMQWIDDIVKSLNTLQASIEQRISRLENKGETTDAAIASIRADVSSLIRGVDGLVSRVNALETAQTATAGRINTLSDRLTAEISELTSKSAALDAKLNVIANAHKEDMKLVNEKMASLDGNMATMFEQQIAMNARVATYDKSIADLQIHAEKSEKTIEKLDSYFKLV